MGDADATGSSLAERLNHLVAATTPAGGKPPTTRELAQQVTEAGHPVSHTYIARLLNGQADDPSMRCLRALATVFGVPAGYFLDDATAAEVDRDLDLLTALRDGGARVIALNARGLSTGSQETVLNVIRQVRLLEGLAPGDDSAGHERG
jgi:transcriptional regulator with XRE-family HTH domain